MVSIAPSSTILSREQTFGLVTQNGGSPQEAGLLTAIAFGPPGGVAESSGNPTVINDNPKTGDYSVGLWQINFRTGINGGVNPTRTLGGVTYTVSQLQNDLNAQAQAALTILRGTGMRTSALSTQWGSFRLNPSGVLAYAQQLTNQFTGIAQPPDQITVNPTTDVGVSGPQEVRANPTVTQGSNPSQASTTSNLNLADSIQHTIIQFLLVLLGIALLLGGIYLIGSKR